MGTIVTGEQVVCTTGIVELGGAMVLVEMPQGARVLVAREGHIGDWVVFTSVASGGRDTHFF